MTTGDYDIPLLEFAHALRAEVEPFYERIHPSGAQIIHEWISDMFEAAADGDAHEVKRLANMAQRKLRLERLWRIQNWLTPCHDRHPRLARWLHGELGYAATAGWLHEENFSHG